MPGELIVGAVAVTLDRAAKVDRDKFVQTLRLSSRVPLKGMRQRKLILDS
jgi:hypothetical protein